MATKTTQLRRLFLDEQLFVLAGSANAFEAKMIESAGFEACYMTGAGTSATLAGLPDAGLLTMTEMVMNASYIANAIEIPLVADADTGYGNALNVRRTIQSFIQAGVAGVHLEDQVTPKRCGFVSGKEVIPVQEAVGKIRSAVDARDELDEDFVIIARTDARGAPGGTLEDAIQRCRAYREAGADVAYVEAVGSIAEMQRCIDEIGHPVMFTLFALPGLPTHEELERMGASCAFHPGLARIIGYRITWEFLHDVRNHGTEAISRWEKWESEFPWNYPPPPHKFDLLGFPAIRQLEERYLSAEELAKYPASVGLYTP